MTGDVQDLVDGLSARLGGPVGVDDRRFRAIAYSSHESEIDPVRRTSILGRQAPPGVIEWLEQLRLPDGGDLIRVPANPELGMVARICLPLRFHERLFGFMWLIDRDEGSDEGEVEAAREAADVIAAALYLEERRESEEGKRRAEAVLRLTGRGGGEAPDPGLTAAELYAALAIEVRGGPTAATAEARLVGSLEAVRRAAAAERILWRSEGRQAILLAAVDDAGQLDAIADELAVAAAAQLEDFPEAEAIIGVGDPGDSVSHLPLSLHRAEVALRIARRVPGVDSPLHWEERPDLALLADLLDGRDPQPFLPATLARLLADHDAEALVATLEAYLAHAGDATAAATELFLHRSSLYNRLRRIEEVAEVDLHDGPDRLLLHVGLLLWRLGGGTTAVD